MSPFDSEKIKQSVFRHGWFGGGKRGYEFVQDCRAVGFLGVKRPVGVVGIDDAEMAFVQMGQHPNEFGITITKDRVAGL